jgi:hypothetical protein
MRHTFKCGIVGESTDMAGDSFLRSMQDAEFMDERKMIDRIQKPVLDELKRTQQALFWLIEQQGGQVRVPSHIITAEPPKPVGEWIVHIDTPTGDIVLRTRKKP